MRFLKRNQNKEVKKEIDPLREKVEEFFDFYNNYNYIKCFSIIYKVKEDNLPEFFDALWQYIWVHYDDSLALRPVNSEKIIILNIVQNYFMKENCRRNVLMCGCLSDEQAELINNTLHSLWYLFRERAALSPVDNSV